MNLRLLLSASVLCALPSLASAQQARELPPIVAESDEVQLLGQTDIDEAAIAARRNASPNALGALNGAPGYASQSNGGISSLPVVRGLADDRILTTIDGAVATAFCPNHMNPTSSYIQAGRLARVTLMPTLAPVSAGGDNIGGVIALDSAPPAFTTSGVDRFGRAGVNYRSVAQGWGANLSAGVANEQLSLGYDAAYAYAENYRRGDGAQVRSTQFESYDQALTLGARSAQGDLLTLRVGRAFVPYEGFPTQRMDMTQNTSVFAGLAYERELSWGEIRAALNWRDVDHEMNFLRDKGGGSGANMPMISEGQDLSALFSVRNLTIEGLGVVAAGAEVFQTRLDDYWPPVAGSMMMGPNTYININDGERDRYAVWGEWTARPAPQWTTSAGFRYEHVETNAGDVQAYSPMLSMMNPDANAASAFNALEHARQDDNIDVNLTAQWRPNEDAVYEFGITRKTRSPNLYERYTWGVGDMSSSMTSFAGDANAYVGDIGLDPEVAHSIAASAEFTGANRRSSLLVSIYHTWVTDYIDADFVRGLPNGFVQLRFANHDAALYGFEMSGRSELGDAGNLGQFALAGAIAYTHGENQDTGDALYHIAPITGRVTLEQRVGRWSNSLELEFVGEKDRINDLRHEPQTGAYTLAHLRTNAQFGSMRLDLGVDNLFDADYASPLGGVSFGDYRHAGGGAQPIYPLPGPGRSFNIGLSVEF
ncbi:TonB-dependent receptor [Terricaulis sp.]|uniref:TonB-dependent receptor n=1 Tax=Terricaulis sp. TaxID=2768686 RepID=UPI0037836150